MKDFFTPEERAELKLASANLKSLVFYAKQTEINTRKTEEHLDSLNSKFERKINELMDKIDRK